MLFFHLFFLLNAKNFNNKNVTGTPIIAASIYAINLWRCITLTIINTHINWIAKFGIHDIENLINLVKSRDSLKVIRLFKRYDTIIPDMYPGIKAMLSCKKLE